jgi:F0F1-type ATP synthase assembly protein I
MRTEESPSNPKKKNSFLKFSGMALQMMVPIAAGAWAGSELDKKQQTEKPVWTIVLSFIGVIIAIYTVIRTVKKLSDES